MPKRGKKHRRNKKSVQVKATIIMLMNQRQSQNLSLHLQRRSMGNRCQRLPRLLVCRWQAEQIS